MDELNRYAKNITSQYGEDGILEEIFRRIGTRHAWCVEFGAWDGKHFSNSWNLWHNGGWNALLIEGDAVKARTLSEYARSTGLAGVRTEHAYVTAGGENSLDRILERNKLPVDIDLLSIDVDGDEYHIFEGFRKCRPRVVVIEFNPTMPPEMDFVQPPGEYLGASARALVRLGESKGYRLAACTTTNCILVTGEEFPVLGIPPVSLEEAFSRENLTHVISRYDGSLYLTRVPAYAAGIPGFGVLSAARILFRRLRKGRTVSRPGKELSPVVVMELKPPGNIGR